MGKDAAGTEGPKNWKEPETSQTRKRNKAGGSARGDLIYKLKN